MAFSLKSPDRSIIGLDIDGRYLAAATIEGGHVARTASHVLPEGLVRDGEVVNPAGLTDALKAFVSEASLPKRVRLGVSNQQIVVRVIDLPRIEDAKQRDAAVRFQAADAIAMPLDEAVLDYQVAGFAESPDGSARMQVVVVAARRKMIEALLGAVKSAGLKIDGIDLDAFALVRALASEQNGEDEPAYVYCHLGGLTNLAIAVGKTCYFTRPLTAVWDDADDAGGRLADEIRLSIDYYMTQPLAKPVAQIVVSGPGSTDSALVQSLELHLGIPVSVAQPLGGLDAVEVSDDPCRFTVAAGLSLGAVA